MRQYECECSQCGNISQISFEETFPEYGELFIKYCKVCEEETTQTRTLTKKTITELKRNREEEELKTSIIEACDKYGFKCRFLFESVIISTPIANWSFFYHDSKITLRHESTIKVNFETGNYAKTHIQFKDRKMKPVEVIDYIAAHDEWRAKN